MTTSMPDERTVLPPDDPHPELTELAAALNQAGQGAYLVDQEGHPVPVPDAVYTALRSVVQALTEGYAMTLAPHGTTLTTQQAADLLGVSRPTLVARLDQGEIPYHRRGRRDRRVMLADVLAYQQRAQRERHAGLDEMAAEGEADGAYDATTTPTRTR